MRLGAARPPLGPEPDCRKQHAWCVLADMLYLTACRDTVRAARIGYARPMPD